MKLSTDIQNTPTTKSQRFYSFLSHILSPSLTACADKFLSPHMATTRACAFDLVSPFKQNRSLSPGDDRSSSATHIHTHLRKERDFCREEWKRVVHFVPEDRRGSSAHVHACICTYMTSLLIVDRSQT